MSTLFKIGLAGVGAMALLGAASAQAGIIPYPNAGTPNPVTYTFTAAATGDILAYFAGSGAGFDEQVGMLDLTHPITPVVGLDDHTSSIGQSLDLGSVTAGDTLVFFDQISATNGNGQTWYSEQSLNVDGGNHVYSTSAAAGQIDPSIPAGTYIGFEDLTFPGSDFNYFDDTFVFTNTATVTGGVPEPATWAMMLLGVGMIGAGMRMARRSDGTAQVAA